MEGFFDKVKAWSRKFYKIPVMTSYWGPAEYAAIANSFPNHIVEGNAIRKIEDVFLKNLRLPLSVGTNRGESAIYAVLRVLPRGEVVIPSYICGNVIASVKNSGHVPVFADVGEDYNLSLRAAKEKLSNRTVAVVVASLYGKPASLREFERLGVSVIDDAAQCLGAFHKGRAVGCYGDAGVYSFGAKTITATAGGLVVGKGSLAKKAAWIARELPKEKTSRVLKRLADCILRYSLRKQALPFLTLKYMLAKKLGRNTQMVYSRISNLDAALALAQWPKVKEINRKRIVNAKILLDELSSTRLELPEYSKEHVYSKFVIRFPSKKERRKKPWPPLLQFVRNMAREGVECEWCYVPLHLKDGVVLAYGAKRANDLERTERLWWRSVAVPNHAGLSEEETKKVAASVKKSLRAL